MTETPVFRLLVSLSVPTVATQLVTVAYNTADTFFVSKIDNSASAAVGAAFALQSAIQALGYGFGMGASSLISRSLGAKKNDDAGRVGTSAFAGAFATGILILIFGLFFLTPLMTLLGSTETMLPYACDYARYIVIAAPVMCGAFVLNSILKAEGDAAFSMIGMCAGSIVNIGLDPLLIFTFGLGISGAAIATGISQLISFAILCIPFVRGRTIVKLKPGNISLSPETYGRILSTGFPTICRQGLASISTTLLNRAAGVYGDVAVAGISLANKVYLLVRNVVLGVGQGMQPIAGYNFGAGNKKRTKRVFRDSVILGTVICVVSSVFIGLFSETVIGWFRDDPDVVSIGGTALKFAAAVMPLMAYSTFVNQMYQCLGFRSQATFLAACRQGVFFIPLALILPKILAVSGVEMLQPASDFCTFLISVPFCIVFYRKYLNESRNI